MIVSLVFNFNPALWLQAQAHMRKCTFSCMQNAHLLHTIKAFLPPINKTLQSCTLRMFFACIARKTRTFGFVATCTTNHFTNANVICRKWQQSCKLAPAKNCSVVTWQCFAQQNSQHLQCVYKLSQRHDNDNNANASALDNFDFVNNFDFDSNLAQKDVVIKKALIGHWCNLICKFRCNLICKVYP